MESANIEQPCDTSIPVNAPTHGLADNAVAVITNPVVIIKHATAVPEFQFICEKPGIFTVIVVD